MVYKPNFKLVKLNDPPKVGLFRGQVVGLGGAISNSFNIYSIWSNVAQNNFEYKFCNVYKQKNFVEYVGHVKESIKIRANVNLRQ